MQYAYSDTCLYLSLVLTYIGAFVVQLVSTHNINYY